eukprot:scaffold324_cov394-Prasinococcus_capsulatus_cf.AAC.26
MLSSSGQPGTAARQASGGGVRALNPGEPPWRGTRDHGTPHVFISVHASRGPAAPSADGPQQKFVRRQRRPTA